MWLAKPGEAKQREQDTSARQLLFQENPASNQFSCSPEKALTGIL
jgi:hypothetical protein